MLHRRKTTPNQTDREQKTGKVKLETSQIVVAIEHQIYIGQWQNV